MGFNSIFSDILKNKKKSDFYINRDMLLFICLKNDKDFLTLKTRLLKLHQKSFTYKGLCAFGDDFLTWNSFKNLIFFSK